jgi:hypothetical protein
MFRVTHTTTKKVLSHLRRLQAEGEALLEQSELGALAQGRWEDRVFRYLKKISADPETFERIMWNDPQTLSLDGPDRRIRTIDEMTKAQKKHVQKALITLVSAMEQFEAQYEE